MTLFIVADVFLRYVFNRPLAYTLELVEIALSLVVFFGVVVCTARQGHIEMNILVVRLPKRAQLAIDCFVYFLCTGLFVVIAWRVFAYAMHTQQIGTVTTILKVPLYPSLLVIALCSVLVTLLLLSQFVHYIRKAISE